MKKFKFYAKIKNCELIFNEKMPPGCVGMQEVTFTPNRKNPRKVWLIKAIKEHIDQMMESFFEIQIERLKDED